MKLVKILIIVTMAVTSFAASTTSSINTSTNSTSSKSIREKLKASDFSFYYLNETGIALQGMDGVDTAHILYAGYKVDKYHTIKIVPTLTTSYNSLQKSQGDAHTQLLSTQLRFYRNKILTEKKHGISLNAQIRNYWYNNDTRTGSNYDTKHRVYLLSSKSFGKISLGAYAFTEIYNRNSGASAHKRNDWASVGVNYNLTDDLSISTSLEYYHAVRKNGGSSETLSINLPALSYNIGDLNISGQTAFNLIKSKDNRDVFAANILREGTFILDIGFSVF